MNDEMEERTLLVDDDAEVRALIASCLRNGGYKLYEAGSGCEAIDMFRKHTGEIGLVVTDVVMPHMFGDQLAARLVELKPTLKVVLMSGNAPETLDTSVLLEPGFNFLQKPFSLTELRACVAQHLAPSA